MPVGKISTPDNRHTSIWYRWTVFARYVVRRFQKDGGLQVASALTYTSLLSIVPLLAVSLAVIGSFGALAPMREAVQSTLLDFLVPSVAMDLSGYINDFLENTKELTAPGVIALAFTAIMMLSTIESTFNRIWRTSGARPWPIRFLAFWAVLTLGPILLGISLALSSTFRIITEQAVGEAAVQQGTLVLTFFLQWAAFTALYLIIPVRRVMLLDALAGGAVAAILFQPLKFGFGIAFDSSNNYQTIYGALAAIPVFLIWLYSFWTLLIIGAQVAAALPERHMLNWKSGRQETTAAARLDAALMMLARLWRAAGDGRSVRSDDPALTRGDLVLQPLVEAGLVVELDGGLYRAGGDFTRIPIAELWQALDLQTPPAGSDAAKQLLAPVKEAERQFLEQPIAMLLDDRQS